MWMANRTTTKKTSNDQLEQNNPKKCAQQHGTFCCQQLCFTGQHGIPTAWHEWTTASSSVENCCSSVSRMVGWCRWWWWWWWWMDGWMADVLLVHKSSFPPHLTMWHQSLQPAPLASGSHHLAHPRAKSPGGCAPRRPGWGTDKHL